MGASGLSQAGDARKQRPFLWHALSRPRHLCEPAPFVLCPLSLALLLGATDSDMQEAGCEVWFRICTPKRAGQESQVGVRPGLAVQPPLAGADSELRVWCLS